MIPFFVPAFLMKKVVAVPLAAGLSLVLAMTIDWTALAAACVTVIVAVGGVASLVINALGKMKLDLLNAANENLLKMETAALAHQHQLEAVAHNVDGITSRADTKRTADDVTIAELRERNAKLERTAELLAQSTAVASVASAVKRTDGT